MKILIIDDDVIFCKTLSNRLAKENIFCDVVHTGRASLDAAKFNNYALLVLDLHLKDISGYEVLERCRQNNIITPIIMLTSESEIIYKLQGLRKGADDYLEKPFVTEELLARMHAVIRRSKGHAQSVIKTGIIELDLNKKVLKVDNKLVNLTDTEYSIVELLMLHQGSTMHKDIFFENVYGGSLNAPEPKIIDVFICKIRKKLDETAGYKLNYIQTVWGRGYIFADNTNQDLAVV